jgi:hypothetical protein
MSVLAFIMTSSYNVYSYCYVRSVQGILVGMRKVLLLWHSCPPPRGEKKQQWLQIAMLKHQEFWMLTFTEFNNPPPPKKKYISDVLLLYNNARQHNRPSQILDRQCCHTHPTVLTMQHQIITYFVLWKKCCGDTTKPFTKHNSTLKKNQWLQRRERNTY